MKNKKKFIIISIIIVMISISYLLIANLYFHQTKWAFLPGYADYIDPTGAYHPGKTIWDLIELFMSPLFSLIPPIIIVYFGLRTWKNQLLLKNEYKIAKNLLKNIYQLRNAINFVRNSYMSGLEQYEAINKENIKIEQTDPKFKTTVLSATYKVRWEKIESASLNLDQILIEAEILWGKEIREQIKPLNKAIQKLNMTIAEYIFRLEENTPFDKEFEKTRIDVMYSVSDDSYQSDFSNEINSSIEHITDYLKPHLKFQF